MRPLPRQQNRQTEALRSEVGKLARDRTVAPFLDGSGQYVSDVRCGNSSTVKVPHLRKTVPRGFLVLNNRCADSGASNVTIFEVEGSRTNESMTFANHGTDPVLFDVWIF